MALDKLTEVLKRAEREQWTRLALVLPGGVGDPVVDMYVKRGWPETRIAHVPASSSRPSSRDSFVPSSTSHSSCYSEGPLDRKSAVHSPGERSNEVAQHRDAGASRGTQTQVQPFGQGRVVVGAVAGLPVCGGESFCRASFGSRMRCGSCDASPRPRPTRRTTSGSDQNHVRVLPQGCRSADRRRLAPPPPQGACEARPRR